MDVHLRSLTDDNRAELEALELAPGQEQFLNTVTEALAEAEEEPGGRAIQFGLFDDDTPVGFVMISDEVEGSDYIAQYLWKLFIDARHQRRGYGTAALDLVAEYFRARPGIDVMWTSAGQGEGSPIPFYERYGFVRTGDIVFDDEPLLRLDL
ncbi:MAG TPA: GNAT family N-acetyltransferase [Gaiellaceae bacterium]|nr:GNAT family N-acetyltransferase [Gaiellaceae bacterium]